MVRNIKEYDDVDIKVGMIIRDNRIARGLSRLQLAPLIGITHQQLAKYEKGENRISVGRLDKLCTILKISPLIFFESSSRNNELLSTRLNIEISRNIAQLKSDDTKRKLNDLIKSMI